MIELRDAIGILGAVVVAWGVGIAVLRLVLGRAAGELDAWERFALSFLLGIVSLALWMVALSLAGIAWSVACVGGVPVLAAVAAWAWRRRAEGTRRGAGSPAGREQRAAPREVPREPSPDAAAATRRLPPGRVNRASGWILAGGALVCVLGCLLEPTAEVDAVAAWGLHAKVFFFERTACPLFLTSGTAGSAILHAPPLVPLAQAWGHLAMGAYDDRSVKLLFVAFYLAMLGAVSSALRTTWDSASVRTLLVPLATTPALIVPFPAGSVASAYADVPLAAFIAGTGAALVRWQSGREIRWLVVAALLAAAAPWVKREGLAFAMNAVGVVGLFAWTDRGRTPAARLAAFGYFAGIVAVSLAVQAVYTRHFPGPFTGEPLEPARLVSAEGIERVGLNLRNLAMEAAQPLRSGILWILFAAVALARFRRFARRPVALALMLLGGQVLAIAVGMALSEYSPERIATLDTRRVLLQVAPLAALALGLLATPGHGTRSAVADSERQD